jgi:hypothetical protein
MAQLVIPKLKMVKEEVLEFEVSLE